jgi:hypothetical protein
MEFDRFHFRLLRYCVKSIPVHESETVFPKLKLVERRFWQADLAIEPLRLRSDRIAQLLERSS